MQAASSAAAPYQLPHPLLPELHPPHLDLPPRLPPSRASSHSSQIGSPQITDRQLRRAFSLARKSYGAAVLPQLEGEESESESGEEEEGMDWEGEGEQGLGVWEKMLECKEDDKMAEKLKEVKTLLKTIDQEQYGLPILSPPSLVEHLIAEPEVELSQATLGRLQGLCAGTEAGHNTETYEAMVEVLKDGGHLPGKALELFRNLPIISLDLSPSPLPSPNLINASSLSLSAFTLPNSFFNLTILNLSSLPLTPLHLFHLRSLSLTALNLSHTPIDLTGIAMLAPLAPRLEKLSLKGCLGVEDECLPVLGVLGKLKWIDLEGTEVGVKEVRRWVVKSEVAQKELKGVCPPACVVEWLSSLPPFPPTAIRDPNLLSTYTTNQLKHQLKLHTHEGSDRDPALAQKVKKETVDGMRKRTKGVLMSRLDDERCKEMMSAEAREGAARWP